MSFLDLIGIDVGFDKYANINIYLKEDNHLKEKGNYIVTIWAGYLQIFGNYLPNKLYMLATCGIIILILMCIVFVGAFSRW